MLLLSYKYASRALLNVVLYLSCEFPVGFSVSVASWPFGADDTVARCLMINKMGRIAPLDLVSSFLKFSIDVQ